MHAAYLIEFIPFPFYLWNIKVFIYDNNVQAVQLKINQTKKLSILFHHHMLPFLKIKRCWECQNFSFRRKGKQEGTCHLKKACEGWGTNERAEDKTWNVISARNARQLVLLRNDAAPLKGGSKRRWRCGFSGRPPENAHADPTSIT